MKKIYEIKELCKKYTNLREEDIDMILKMADSISYFCEISDADIFIDCFSPDGKSGIVVAHGKPEKSSLYNKNIQGEIVLPENEPTVFYTGKTGIPIRDAKGLSQERKWVVQHTMPLKNNSDEVIAVLIEEHDITDKIKLNKKLNAIKNSSKNMADNIVKSQNTENKVNKEVMFQEMHHRIKNNLQIVSSILSMQERRSKCEETKEVLKDNINRINNMARIHEVMMNSEGKTMDVTKQIANLADSMMSFACDEFKDINIKVSGSEAKIDSDKLITILMVVNEILINSIRHGYDEQDKGEININIVGGTFFTTVIVEDDGKGIQKKQKRTMGLGSDLIKLLVHEELQGDINVTSTESGTCVQFDFSMQ